MTDDTGKEAPKKRRLGRPRVHPEGGRRPQLAFRVRGDRYDQLKSLAELRDRSISEVVEDIIDRYFENLEQAKTPANTVGAAMTQALRLAALSVGSQYNQSQEGYDAAVSAIFNIIAVMKKPDGYKAPKSLISMLGQTGGLGVEEASLEERLSRQRADAIGNSAAALAVSWSDGSEERQEHTHVLLSRGRFFEDGYDRDAFLRSIKSDQTPKSGTERD